MIPSMAELESLDRKCLQALAKEHGVKANQKSSAIVAELMALQGAAASPQQEKRRSSVKPKTPVPKADVRQSGEMAPEASTSEAAEASPPVSSKKRRSSAKQPAVLTSALSDEVASPKQEKRRSSAKPMTPVPKADVQHSAEMAPEASTGTSDAEAAEASAPVSTKKRCSSAKQPVVLTSSLSEEVASPKQEKRRSSVKPKTPVPKADLPLERKKRGSDAFWKRVPSKHNSSAQAKPVASLEATAQKQAEAKPASIAGTASGSFSIGVKDSQRTGYRVPKAFVVKKSLKTLKTVVPFKAGERPASAHSRSARQDENAKTDTNIKAAGSDAKLTQAAAARKQQVVAGSSNARATAVSVARGISTGAASKNPTPWRGTGYKAATHK